MSKSIRLPSIVMLILALGSGCATHYSNNELHNIFNTKGFTTKDSELGVVVLLPEVFFEFGSTTLTSVAHKKLSIIGDVLVDPKVQSRYILVEGHSDSVGNPVYNQQLSQQRADVVANDLILRSVNANRITKKGYGEKYPVAPNKKQDGSDNPEGRALNRRVEIILENLK